MTKYEQIAIYIKEKIINGEYKANEQLPFEKVICENLMLAR